MSVTLFPACPGAAIRGHAPPFNGSRQATPTGPAYPSVVSAMGGGNVVVSLFGVTLFYTSACNLLLQSPSGAYAVLFKRTFGNAECNNVAQINFSDTGIAVPTNQNFQTGVTYRPTYFRETGFQDMPAPAPALPRAADWPHQMNALSGDGEWKLFVSIMGSDVHYVNIDRWTLTVGGVTYAPAVSCGCVSPTSLAP